MGEHVKSTYARSRYGGHTCHAMDCDIPCEPKRLFCAKHWNMVPTRIKSWVWRTYRPGQELDKDPSSEYLEAATAAIRAVALREGKISPTVVPGDVPFDV